MTLTREKIPQVRSITRMITRRLQNLGVPRNTAQDISSRFRYQLLHQGEAGAIRYLKACGEKLQSYLYGSTSLQKDEKPIWVATRAKFPLFFAGLENAGEDILMRVSKLARAIRLGTVHQDQVDKVTQAVVTPYGGTSYGIAKMTSLVKLGCQSLDLMGAGQDMTEYNLRIPLITKKFAKVVSTSCDMAKAFSSDNEKSLSSVSNLSEPPLLESLQLMADHPELQVGNWTGAFHPLENRWVEDIVNDLQRPVEHRNPFVGEIHFTLEGAGKIRSFSAPYSIVACVLYPLHFLLADLRDRFMDTDCTLDQEKGAIRITEWLNAGDVVHSVDLSTATCRFPLEPQLKYLEFLGVPEEYINALRYVARGHWHCGPDAATAFAVSSLQWEVGQPLGIPPSMSAFASVHNLLLRGLALELGLNPDTEFVILGDDVGIRTPALAERYMQILSECDVPISWTKTHASSQYGEFAGYSISRTNKTRAGQWRIAGYTNMLEIAANVGRPLVGETSLFHQEIQKLYLFKQGIYSPPPADWPEWIRLLTEFQLCFLERWTTYSAPYWHFKIQDVYCSQVPFLKSYGNDVLRYRSNSGLWPFKDEWKSLSEVMFDYLAKVAREKDAEMMDPDCSASEIVHLMWYDSQCDPGGSSSYFGGSGDRYPSVRMLEILNRKESDVPDLKTPSDIMWDAYTVLNTLWWTGAFSELEYHTHTMEICERARSLLYMPQKASTQNQLIALGKRIGDFLRKKDKIRASTEYTSVRSGYYRFS